MGRVVAGCLVAVAVAAYAVDVRISRRDLGGEASPLNDAYVSTYEVVTSWPHDTAAFTQGLVFDDAGQLYESDGLYRKSGVRSVHVQTGSSDPAHGQRRTANTATHFGEGIAIVGGKMLQLTWREQVVNEFALPGLTLTRSHALPCARANPPCQEGWGLAYDGASRLYLTDSTDKLFFLDPTTLESVAPPRQIYDHKMKRAVHGVNELEWVDGELWGNVFPMYQGEASECIVRLNASDASVLGWIDLRGLLAKQREAVRLSSHNYVLNGIAYHPNSKRLYVTGKQWDHMYQLRIKPASAESQTGKYVESACHLGRADGKRAFG